MMYYNVSELSLGKLLCDNLDFSSVLCLDMPRRAGVDTNSLGISINSKSFFNGS